MPRLIDPRAAFERMFGARDAAGKLLPQPSRAENQGLLDAALDDARSLRKHLGRSDQHKLDEFLDSVRSVEKRLGFERRYDVDSWRPPTKPDDLTPAARHAASRHALYQQRQRGRQRDSRWHASH